MLSERGAPTPVAWTRLRAPQSLMAPAPAEAVAAAVAPSAAARRVRAGGRPGVGVRAAGGRSSRPPPARPPPAPGSRAGPRAARRRGAAPREQPEPDVVEQVVKSSAFKSFLRSAGTVLGREITRSVLGTASRKRR